MKRLAIVLFSVAIACVQTHLTLAQDYHDALDITVTLSPEKVIIDGKPIVYYEMHIKSFSKDSIHLKNLEVIHAHDSSVIGRIAEDDLKNRLGMRAGDRNNVLSPGSSCVMYVELVLPEVRTKLQVFHRLDFELVHSGIRDLANIAGANMWISDKPGLSLGSPLRDGPWAAIYDPSWGRGHRRVFYTVDGEARIPGRFAIDFIKLNAQGMYAAGDDDQIVNWLGYGNDVLSVADGVVVSVKDDFIESPTLKAHPSYAAEKATGNYIAIDIGGGRFVFYEHLKPQSIKVQRGHHVKKGEVIASLGFTGQTTGPHLHFHVADKNSALGAEGIPFAFETFTLLGAYRDLEKFGKEPWIEIKSGGEKKSGERPASNSVIRFSF